MYIKRYIHNQQKENNKECYKGIRCPTDSTSSSPLQCEQSLWDQKSFPQMGIEDFGKQEDQNLEVE